jgi:Predicted aminoglycoside phosphotransferase
VIDALLVCRLVREQFPQWGHLPVRPVEFDGVDNCTFHLGDDMTVRLPSSEGYRLQVDKEQRWLPVLAPHLPLPIPVPLARGIPGEGYPFSWSVCRWLDGENASVERIDDLSEFATTLADFLNTLRDVDPTDGPMPGRHNFFRGGPLDTYDAETRRAIDALKGQIPTDAATEMWDTAMAATWLGTPVWFHGDVAAGNLLVRDGRLTAVIDFGTSGIGDPACDVVIAWTLLSGESREAFRDALTVDSATWARGRGWALWKALITLVDLIDTNPAEETNTRRIIEHVLGEG